MPVLVEKASPRTPSRGSDPRPRFKLMSARPTSTQRCCLRCEHELAPESGRDPSAAGSTGDLIEHRCPECGAAFDPANPRSFRRGRRSGFERVVGRCGLLFALLPVPLTLLAWYGESVPAGYFLPFAISFLGLLGYGVVWAIRLGTRLEIRLRLGGPGPIASREWVWLIGPLILAACVIVGRTSVPMRIGLAAAHADLERLRVEAQDGTLGLPNTAGWSSIEAVEVVWLFVEDRIDADGRRRSEIVNVLSESEFEANPVLAEKVRASVADPGAMLRPGSRPAEGQGILETIRFKIRDAGFLDSGWWGWIANGPDRLGGFDQSWRRIAGDWYEMRETW